MEMRKRCPVCQFLNPKTAVICKSPLNCGADLTYATEVESNPGPADPIGSTPPTPELEVDCRCRYPLKDPARPGYCEACQNRLRRSVDGGPALPGGRPKEELPPTKRPLQVRMHWPSGLQCTVGQGLLIGRHVSCVPPELLAKMQELPTLSRVHAWVGFDRGHLVVLDLGSHNGTWVGEQRLQPGSPYSLQLDSHAGSHVTVQFGPSIQARLTWEGVA